LKLNQWKERKGPLAHSFSTFCVALFLSQPSMANRSFLRLVEEMKEIETSTTKCGGKGFSDSLSSAAENLQLKKKDLNPVGDVRKKFSMFMSKD